MSLGRWPLLILAVAAVWVLYFFGLSNMGLIGPDEPRYAAIGFSMAGTGNWVTPMLWGQPWFEKPALLYWMTAAGFKLGLDAELAPRLPVALAGVAFLAYFFFVLRREFGHRAALYATGTLATSAGWLAYSHISVPDLPLAAAFGAAMLTVMRGRGSLIAGALLGIAILAKGLVPVVLFLPALWFLRGRLREILLIGAAAFVVAAPWYILVIARYGSGFIDQFFWKHQFARFVSGESLHAQPVWFYLPIVVAGFFPWSPLLGTLFTKRLYQDRRVQFLLAWFAFGFVFFSVSRGKLPGYLLPLLPAVAALVGIALDQAQHRSALTTGLVALSAALPWFVPSIQELLPQALVSGLTRSHFHLASTWMVGAIASVLAVALLDRRGRRATAFLVVTLLATASVLELVSQVFPVLDRDVSGRAAWISSSESITCISSHDAPRRFSIDYYAGGDLSDCN